MRINPLQTPNFEGRLIGCSWLKPKQRKVFSQVRPCVEKMIKNKDVDVRIYLSYGNELRMSAGKKPAYTVIESDNPEIWINRAKEVIEGFEHDRSINIEKLGK